MAATIEKGIKRSCLSCSTKFYDFNRTPILCPHCETEFVGFVKVKGKRGRPVADLKESKVVKAKVVEEEEDEDDIVEEDDDTISIDDIEEDDDDIVDDDDIDLEGDLDDDDDDDDIDLELDDDEELDIDDLKTSE